MEVDAAVDAQNAPTAACKTRGDVPEMWHRVPFPIWMPDHPAGGRSSTPMNTRVVYPLILDWLRGRPLTPFLVEAEAQRIPPKGYDDPVSGR